MLANRRAFGMLTRQENGREWKESSGSSRGVRVAADRSGSSIPSSMTSQFVRSAIRSADVRSGVLLPLAPHSPAGQHPEARRLASITGYALYNFALQETTLDIRRSTRDWIQQGDLEFGVFGCGAGCFRSGSSRSSGGRHPRGILNIPGSDHRVRGTGTGPAARSGDERLSTGGVSPPLHASVDALGQRQARKAN